MTKLRITVTKEILEKSKMCGTSCDSPSTAENCAIALAIRDVFPDALVGPHHILFDGRSLEVICDLPVAAIKFIKEFDNSSPEMRTKMDPISFEIEVPSSVIDKINIDELKPLLENHPTLALV